MRESLHNNHKQETGANSYQMQGPDGCRQGDQAFKQTPGARIGENRQLHFVIVFAIVKKWNCERFCSVSKHDGSLAIQLKYFLNLVGNFLTLSREFLVGLQICVLLAC